MFELRYTPAASADIKNLDGSIRKHLRKVLDKKLAIDPQGYGLPLRRVLTNFLKHEFGNHRIIYQIYAVHNVVVVCAVGPRREGDNSDVYRRLDAVAKTGRLAEQVRAVLGGLHKVLKGSGED